MAKRLEPIPEGRYVTLTALDGKRVSLGAYVRAVKRAKASPDATFKHGLDCWWSVTGRQIMRQFHRAMHQRISAAIPYVERGC